MEEKKNKLFGKSKPLSKHLIEANNKERQNLIAKVEKIMTSIEVKVLSTNKIINKDLYFSIQIVEVTNLPVDNDDLVFLFKSIKSIFKTDGFLKRFDSDNKIIVEYHSVQNRFIPDSPFSESIIFDTIQKPSLGVLVKKTFLKNLKQEMFKLSVKPL
ncbi:hypothetical protein [Olleya aquimaris]|uniref:Uncharacterized protein n=1 Tax=Olleya aquimaris TaxID=639310 RepID=A0A327RLR9_9FLAO|nr:hypothetical protein [Olleya aquimaris]RAJ17829.1 hypothetical protein LY08_00097 [Olleya aquimaris]